MKSKTSAYISTIDTTRIDRIDNRRRKIDWQYWPNTDTQQDYKDESRSHAAHSSRPDIEDEAIIPWGLAQSQAPRNESTTIDVLFGEGTALHWKHSVTDRALEIAMNPQDGTRKERFIRMW
ncbi:hypothetical protein EK21DRAFT_114228 [Setomelanomma holmii]|uniref:Uncharacterized protein n=1 Tax=Setomelanomma holmii TaxID=210430 RepID=A0A9P4H5R1_9PLEO|nr:hypothetical protein EK21DRAFT_114228 [Setomelanomma holmii]